MDNRQRLRELTERLPFVGFPGKDIPVRILIVEEEKSINRLMVDTLEYFGCICRAADTATTAFKEIEENEFDVLIANVVLPKEGDGIKVVKTFQAKSPNSIVIIMSSDEDRLRDYSRFFVTLAMPFGIFDLVRKVKNGVDQKK